jgi:hypothetical protein
MMRRIGFRQAPRTARWLACCALAALALWWPGSEPRSQTPAPAPPAAEPAAPPAKPRPAARPGSRSNEGRFNPSEEVSPDNDVPFPVDI